MVDWLDRKVGLGWGRGTVAAVQPPWGITIARRPPLSYRILGKVRMLGMGKETSKKEGEN